MIGACSFALGTSTWFSHTRYMFPLMLAGRFFIGIGVTAVKIVMDRVVSFWFADGIEFAWGVTISMARLGTVMNFIGTAYIAEKLTLGIACWVGALLGALTFLLAIVLVCLDVYGARRSNVYQRHDTEAKKLSFGRIKEFNLQFWFLIIILAAFYANFNPFVSNGSQWMSDKYGIHKTTASYIVGISSDVAVIFSPIFGALLTKFGGRSFAVFLGCVLIIPVYVLVLFTRVSPIIINIVMGFNYVFIVVSLWPAISKSVPVDLVGTALGITSLFSGILAGLSTLGVGKLLNYLNKDKAPYSMSSWAMVMITAIFATLTACLGSSLFALATTPPFRMTSAMFPLMMTGRILLGAGNGACQLVQDRVIAFWFYDKLGLAFGVIVSVVRCGSVLNFLLTSNIATSHSVAASTWFGSGMCFVGFLASIGYCIMETIGRRAIDSEHFFSVKSQEMAIVQDRVVTFWFPDRLEFAWGFTVSTFRIGTVLNFLVTANIASYYGLDVATWVGAVVSTVGFLSSIVLVCLDVYGSKKVDVYAKCKKDKKQFSFRRICEFTPSYWLTTAILVTFYSNFIPFVANGGQWIHDKYGIPKTTASYINGISSDVPVILSPIVGALLTRTGGRGTAAMFGSFLVLPMYLLVLYSYITPVVTSLLFGTAYVFVAVSLWPAITASVPLELVGTAIGLTNVFGGLCTGLSSLGIGKLLEHLSKIHGDNSLENWNIAMLILLGIEALSLGASVALSVKEVFVIQIFSSSIYSSIELVL
ncbi:hypothetical protein FSP39_009821 [Pinctada imbricata]|uniref:Lysosomal dipeptide transporter MFSD1 n=1 Tax=Pinctada imbricata TaxID=66713 RepID=A0AA88Y650_PINIB|nr:hypothetical protein FSP39_009821 [Pinctada imbricata]